MGDQRFLGLTKDQFLVAIVVSLAFLVVLLGGVVVYLEGQTQDQAATIRHLKPQASAGAETHTVLCRQHRDHVSQLRQDNRFLRMTIPQRVRAYGESFGTIPGKLIQRGIRTLEDDLKADRGLHC